MVNIEMQVQNLRNKYNTHSVIQPIINYCEENKLGFEFLKESIFNEKGIKSFNETNIYYMKIGNNLIKQEAQVCGWDDLLKLINSAYEHLHLKQPDNLSRAVKTFKKYN